MEGPGYNKHLQPQIVVTNKTKYRIIDSGQQNDPLNNLQNHNVYINSCTTIRCTRSLTDGSLIKNLESTVRNIP